MHRELEKHLARARQTAEEDLEATGGSKVRFSFEARDSRQSLQMSSNVNSLHYCGLHYLSLCSCLCIFVLSTVVSTYNNRIVSLLGQWRGLRGLSDRRGPGAGGGRGRTTGADRLRAVSRGCGRWRASQNKRDFGLLHLFAKITCCYWAVHQLNWPPTSSKKDEQQSTIYVKQLCSRAV